MSTRTYQIPNGSKVLLFFCDEKGCDRPASYGENVNIRAALETGDPKRAGTWWCPNHNPYRKAKRDR